MLSVRHLLVLILTWSALSGIMDKAAAQPGDLQNYVEEQARLSGVPGVAYALVEDGKLTTTGAYGVTAKNAGQPVTDRTLFVIGSISKSFTAVSIMQLVEQGMVELDAPISTYLPSFKEVDAGVITVRQLLSHTSGYSIAQGNANQTDLSKVETALATRVEKLARVTPATAPGAKWDYSNANYQLLGRIIERQTGQSFSDYIENNIFAAAGMADSQMVDWADRSDIGRPHRPWFWTKLQYDGTGIGRGGLPQGGVMSSARDMAIYLMVMMNGEDDILTADSKALMMQPGGPTAPLYGFGWQLAPEEKVVFHSGANPGFEALASMRPADRDAFVILANGGSGFGFGDTTNLRRGATTLALTGKATQSSNLPRKATFLVMLALPILLVLAIGRLWRRRHQMATITNKPGPVKIWLPLVLVIGLAWLLLVFVPNSFGVNISTVVLFQPDIGLLLIAGAVLALLWVLLRTILFLKLPSGG